MAKDTGLTWVYLGDLVKERDEKGYLHVKGIATDSSLDADQQICDPIWLEKAMNDWFKIGNVREMHDKKAAGKAVNMEWVNGQCLVDIKVVDKDAAEKVAEDIYCGLSIGIKGARVLKDAAALGGRIADGVIPEVSLVDRPANYNAMLLKKGMGLDTDDPEWATSEDLDLTAVLEKANLVIGKADPADNNPDGTDVDDPEVDDTDTDDCTDCDGTAWLSAGEPCPTCNADGAKTAKVDAPKRVRAQAVLDMLDVLKATPLANGVIEKDGAGWLHDPNVCKTVVAGITQMLKTELDEQADGEDERWDIQNLELCLNAFLTWQEKEASEGETESPFNQGDDMDAFITLDAGLVDLVKVASAPEATAVDKDALAEGLRKSIGLDEVFADYEAVKAILAESGSKSLAEELASIRVMATPGGPYVGPALSNTNGVHKGSEIDRLTADLHKFRKMAATVNQPDMAREYTELANQAYDALVNLGVNV